MLINKGLFTSKTDEWETPQWLFDQLNLVYHFQTDVCATAENAKCGTFFTREQDGLKQNWGGICWCNPPYGRQILAWVEKAAKADAFTVMLLPARTDTEWFHEFVLPKGRITFLRGRLRFGGSTSSAPFPSMLVEFNNLIRLRGRDDA